MKEENDKIKLSLHVAKLYYLDGLTQGQIAKQVKISRPTVSRLLSYAREEGLVKIEIEDPLRDAGDLAHQLEDRYGLKKVIVVPTGQHQGSDQLAQVGEAAADYVEEIVSPNDIVGIAWGKTIHQVARHLKKSDVPGVQVVQLKGGGTALPQNTYAYECINGFANAFQTTPVYLPLPVIFDHQQTKELVESDRHIGEILDLGRRANVAVYTVGTVRDSALLFQLGYFTEDEQHYLQEHAVGDAFSRFIDDQGQIVVPKLNDRTIGIQLDDLKDKEYSVVVSGTLAKVPAIRAVLRAGYANVLIIDQASADHLFELGK